MAAVLAGYSVSQNVDWDSVAIAMRCADLVIRNDLSQITCALYLLYQSILASTVKVQLTVLVKMRCQFHFQL